MIDFFLKIIFLKIMIDFFLKIMLMIKNDASIKIIKKMHY
jgi:hypothetical protein